MIRVVNINTRVSGLVIGVFFELEYQGEVSLESPHSPLPSCGLGECAQPCMVWLVSLFPSIAFSLKLLSSKIGIPFFSYGFLFMK